MMALNFSRQFHMLEWGPLSCFTILRVGTGLESPEGDVHTFGPSHLKKPLAEANYAILQGGRVSSTEAPNLTLGQICKQCRSFSLGLDSRGFRHAAIDISCIGIRNGRVPILIARNRAGAHTRDIPR